MATLKKHGKQLGRIHYGKFDRVYYQDGTILENSGFGWTVWGKVKPGIDPAQAHTDRVTALKELYAERPALKRYTDLLRDIPLSWRWKFVAALDIMPTDPDGIWSEMDDAGHHMDLEDINDICKARTAAQQEYAAIKAEKGVTPA